MNKSDFIEAISESSGLTKSDSSKALEGVMSVLTDLLAKDDSIVLPGFASIGVKKRKARNGRNPSTGESMALFKFVLV